MAHPPFAAIEALQQTDRWDDAGAAGRDELRLA
jgi:hypothetical protein